MTVIDTLDKLKHIKVGDIMPFINEKGRMQYYEVFLVEKKGRGIRVTFDDGTSYTGAELCQIVKSYTTLQNLRSTTAQNMKAAYSLMTLSTSVRP